MGLSGGSRPLGSVQCLRIKTDVLILVSHGIWLSDLSEDSLFCWTVWWVRSFLSSTDKGWLGGGVFVKCLNTASQFGDMWESTCLSRTYIEELTFSNISLCLGLNLKDSHIHTHKMSMWFTVHKPQQPYYITYITFYTLIVSWCSLLLPLFTLYLSVYLLYLYMLLQRKFRCTEYV